MQGKIILLNGVSSSGKSTIAKELVKMLPDYFHFSIDDFDSIIEKMEDRAGDHLIPVPTEHFFHVPLPCFLIKASISSSIRFYVTTIQQKIVMKH